MGKKKVNPRRIPMQKTSIDSRQIIKDSLQSSMAHAWYLVVSALLETELANPEEIVTLYSEVSQFTWTAKPDIFMLDRAERLMGKERPAALDASHINSEYELNKYKKNVEKMSLHTSLCVICLGLEKRFSSDELRRLFFVEDLTEAEIHSGRLDYKELELQLQSKNVRIGFATEKAFP